MGLNGTSNLINGKVSQSKSRGRSFVEELSREYGNEESTARKEEGTKKPTKHDKRK